VDYITVERERINRQDAKDAKNEERLTAESAEDAKERGEKGPVLYCEDAEYGDLGAQRQGTLVAAGWDASGWVARIVGG
jgi:hypothetical protein